MHKEKMSKEKKQGKQSQSEILTEKKITQKLSNFTLKVCKIGTLTGN
jgi:hypothetical protein